MKNFLPFILTAIITGCFAPAQMPVKTQNPENNQTYKVDYLFEHDGCKVYRFYDRGNCVYFTNCNGEAIVKTDSTEVRNTIRR
jgi:Domain of unknown function (DUF4884)